MIEAGFRTMPKDIYEEVHDDTPYSNGFSDRFPSAIVIQFEEIPIHSKNSWVILC